MIYFIRNWCDLHISLMFLVDIETNSYTITNKFYIKTNRICRMVK